MDGVARLDQQERDQLFRETAVRRGDIDAPMVEKDFWVCWTLKRVFSLSERIPHLVFKGGTSLSKVYDVIHRFSEDVDLSLHRSDLGFGDDRDPAGDMSNKRRRKLLQDLQTECERYIADELMPVLASAFGTALGSAEGWGLQVDDRDCQTVLFNYPAGAHTSDMQVPAYVRPVIRLELGARSDHWPSEDRVVHCYAAEQFPDYFDDPSCQVHVLNAERTFWEKVTLLHAEYHRNPDSPIRVRLSRHYYDLAQLAETPIADSAVADLSLLDAVREHKMCFFRSGWANYETACPGTVRIVPPEFRITAIRQDYRRMGEMIFGTPPSLDHILAVLTELEQKINRSSP